MNLNLKTKSAALLIVMLSSCVCAAAQEKAQDRRKFLDPSTPVSDDPRRIPVKPGPQGPDRIFVLRGGRIFDGTGTAAHKGTLVIERNKISKILPTSSTDWPKNAADATLRAVEKLRYFLESGITSVRDVGSQGDVTFRLKEWVRDNRLAGPRVFPAGQFITAEGGHSTENTPDEWIKEMGATRIANGPDDWRLAVREQFHKGADVIKLGSHFSFEEIKAAVQEAHELGLKVTVDSETFYIQRAVRCRERMRRSS